MVLHYQLQLRLWYHLTSITTLSYHGSPLPTLTQTLIPLNFYHYLIIPWFSTTTNSNSDSDHNCLWIYYITHKTITIASPMLCNWCHHFYIRTTMMHTTTTTSGTNLWHHAPHIFITNSTLILSHLTPTTNSITLILPMLQNQNNLNCFSVYLYVSIITKKNLGRRRSKISIF